MKNMSEKYKFNEEVTLEFDYHTTFTMLALLGQTRDNFPKDKMLLYYSVADSRLSGGVDADDIEEVLTKDFKEKGNEYVVAKMYLGCYWVNLGDIVMYPGDVEGDILRETLEIWQKYGLNHHLLPIS